MIDNLKKIETKILDLLKKEKLTNNEKFYLKFLIENLTLTEKIKKNIFDLSNKKKLSENEKLYLDLLNKKFYNFKTKENNLENIEIKEKNNLKTENILREKFKKSRHYPSSVREWNNSVYLYNKNNLNLIPSAAVNAMKIIKGYFSLFNQKLEKKMRTKRLLLRFRKLSSNRIYLSKGEFKHNNNNVLINIYLFNRQKHNYLLKLKNIYLKSFLKKDINQKFIKIFKLICLKSLNSIAEINKNKYLLVKALDIVEKNKKYKINYFRILSDSNIKFYKKLLKLTMRKLRLYFYYKQLVYINKSKFNYNYLNILKKHLENLYNKNVEFNLINLKRFYLNSDILSESVKLKIIKNKNKLRKILNKLKDKVKIYKKKHFLGFNLNKKIKIIKYPSLLRRSVISKLKYRHVTGYRLEANGRLSRRNTASRSVHKLSYKGNLLNIDSSFRRLSTVILKGNLRPNVQYTKLNSKTRIGSFGIKGWVSGN